MVIKKKDLYKKICNHFSPLKIRFFLNDWTQAHRNKGVGDPQPYGADERRGVGEGHKWQHGHREDGADQQYDATQTHQVLQPAQHQASKAISSVRDDSRRHTHPYSYDETSCDSRENQRADVDAAGNIDRLLVTIVAELVEDELTGSETDVYYN